MSDFEDLKNLVNSEDWPVAVNNALICNSLDEQEKLDRGEAISEVLLGNTKNKKVLDFGCGEGHVALVTKSNMTVGYDLIKTGQLAWENQQDNLLLTTDFEQVVKLAPYDVVLLYDVIDHADNPLDVLEKIRLLSNPNTEIFVKCHPWCSRHGSHSYTSFNKAFVHLIFSEEELDIMGVHRIKTNKVIAPLYTYKTLFDDSKLQIKSEYVERQDIEQFFFKPILKNRIYSVWNRPLEQEFPKFQMEQTFVNYELKVI